MTITKRERTRILSGIQPTGEMTLGNYLGAVRRWAADQDTNDAFYPIVDLHALTVSWDPAELRTRTRNMAIGLLAAGLDPEKVTVFVQSQVPEHTECAWFLNCIATFGEMNRMTQFKDKSQGKESVSLGLFTYPALMAADILLYDADEVPVGDDQVQHVEITRDIAIRFNHRLGETFVVPKYTIAEAGARVMDLQTPESKMSKSSVSPQGTIIIFEDPKSIEKKFKSAVTDSETDIRHDRDAKPGVSNLLEIYANVVGCSIPEAEAKFAGSQYGAFKTAVAEAVIEEVRPVRERYETLAADPAEVDRVLALGRDKARAVSVPVMERVRERVGLLTL